MYIPNLTKSVHYIKPESYEGVLHISVALPNGKYSKAVSLYFTTREEMKRWALKNILAYKTLKISEYKTTTVMKVTRAIFKTTAK
jgi:hypothetical protein